MSGRGRLFIVGLGPGDRAAMTPQALEALHQAEVVVGYTGYFTWIADLVAGKECLALPLTQETIRARVAVARMREGKVVCIVSSGDPGVYGMAALVLECLGEEGQEQATVIPGVSAIHAAAALVGAPLSHDFAVVSLSDLLTPWEVIERRLIAAAEADFVLALLNPQSRRRDWQYRRAQEILASRRAANTPVGVVRNAYRPEQSVELTTVARMAEANVDMFTTVIVGSARTRRLGQMIVTPRGYDLSSKGESVGWVATQPTSPTLPPDAIMAESFRIIDGEVGEHSFSTLEWPVVQRMIHASGDLEMVRLASFSPGAVAAAVRAFQEGASIVTDVRMVASGIQAALREPLGVELRCFLDDPGLADEAEAQGDDAQRHRHRASGAVLAGSGLRGGERSDSAVGAMQGRPPGSSGPRLVVAMPVGFVGVVASKEEAFALPVPVIAVRGRRGGSAVAAAAVNALLLLARKETGP